MGGRAVSRLDADTHAFLGQVANQAHIVVENSRLVERLRDLAIRDSLTELYNHRHAMDLLENEFERVGRYAAGVSLLMLDLDEFKRVNDEHGHPAGDAVLTEMARLLKETLRTVDAVGRYGGEEFVIILPHTSPEEAKATGERIRQQGGEPRVLGGTEAPQRDRERGGGQLPHGQRGLAGEPGPRGRPRPLPREGSGTEPGGMRDERARTPRDVSVAEMEALLGLALRRGATSPISTSSTRRRLPCPRRGHHPHRHRRGFERARGAGGQRRALGLRLHRRLVSGSPPKAAETAAYIALGTRSLPPERVAAAGFDRRYGARALSGLPLPDRIALVERADRAARAYDPRVEKVFVTLGESTKTLRIANSAGVLAEDVQPLFSLRVSVIAAEKGVRRDGTAGGGGRLGPEFFVAKPPEHFAREAARMAVTLLSAAGGPGGRDAGGAGAGLAGHPAARSGGPRPRGRLQPEGHLGLHRTHRPARGRARVTVVDDGTISDRRGSLNVDDEGRPPGRTVLIEDGILRGYLQDDLNARLMKMPATGNGRRQDYTCLPLPRMTNTFMMAGSDDPQDIIRSVKRGLYAPHFGGGQVDITSGKFVFSATEAYLIEDGRIGAPVVGATLIGNGPDVLNRGHAHRPRPEARRGHRHLRQGGPERARGGGPAYDPGLGV